ncbi:MAG TPA: sigma-70 family RNA polymerase sigma factor [Candidatus Binatus sp.]|nr:sigma-70 family RNA polymerase sigma factor [Candidatus Binatus sp.]
MHGNTKEVSKTQSQSKWEAANSPYLDDELHLVKRAQSGDKSAFGSLIQPYIRKAYHVALKITRNREDAEDASQQSLLNAYAHIHQFRGQSRFSSWLMRIAMNEALIKVRKRRSEDHYLTYENSNGDEPSPVQMLSAGDAYHPEKLYSKAEDQRALREAINGLGSGSRVVVWLLGMQEWQAKEAATVLKLSQSAVKTRFSRARQQLRECLAERV